MPSGDHRNKRLNQHRICEIREICGPNLPSYSIAEFRLLPDIWIAAAGVSVQLEELTADDADFTDPLIAWMSSFVARNRDINRADCAN